MQLVGCVGHRSVRANTVINHIRLFVLTIIFHFLIPKHVSRHEISPQNRGKENNSKTLLGKVYSHFAASVAFEWGSSLQIDSRVCSHLNPGKFAGQHTAGASVGCSQQGPRRAGQAGDPRCHPAGTVTRALLFGGPYMFQIPGLAQKQCSVLPSKRSWFPIIGQPMHSTYKALLLGWHV